MNKIEADLFRYCCKQADYTKSKLYVFEYNFDINLFDNAFIIQNIPPKK